MSLHKTIKILELEIKAFSKDLKSGAIPRTVESMGALTKLANNLSRMYEQAGLSKASELGGSNDQPTVVPETGYVKGTMRR